MSQPLNSVQPRRGGSVHWRGLTSLTVTISFILLSVTGVILYISPQGRVANWTGWNVIGLSKHQWAAVHTTAALLFVIASVLHVYFNWRLLLHYVVFQRRLNLTREMIGALAITAAVVAGTLLEVPPFGSVTALNDRIKMYWESRDVQAPYAHAEASSLAEFSERTGIPLSHLQDRLSRAGVQIDDTHAQTIEDLAQRNGLSPRELFAQMETQQESRGGWGRQTVRGICQSGGIPLQDALNALHREGFEATPDSTLRALADQKGTHPSAVKDFIEQAD